MVAQFYSLEEKTLAGLEAIIEKVSDDSVELC